MTVLVTGASGFLGGALAKALVEKGRKVRVLVRKTSNIEHLKGLPVEMIYGDIKDKSSLSAAVKDVKRIYHSAAMALDWGNWEDFHQANVGGVQNMLEAAQKVKGLEVFTYISTTDVYGYPKHPCDESHPLTDIGLPYNKSKVMAEEAVWESYKKHGVPVTVIRPANIYGPRSKDFVVEIAEILFKEQMVLVDKGEVRAGLIYVDNCVEGIIKASMSPKAIGQAYNLRDESDETWKEYFETLAKGLGAPVPRKSMSGGMVLAMARVFEFFYSLFRVSSRPLLTRHAMYVVCRDQGYSIEKARRDFGFKSGINFSKAMEKTIRWARSQNLNPKK